MNHAQIQILTDLNKTIESALQAGLPWVDIENEIYEARTTHDPYYDGDHE